MSSNEQSRGKELSADQRDLLLYGIRELDAKMRKLEDAAKDMSLGLEEIAIMRHGSGMSKAANIAEACIARYRALSPPQTVMPTPIASVGGDETDEAWVKARKPTAHAIRSEVGGWFIHSGLSSDGELGYSSNDDVSFAWADARRRLESAPTAAEPVLGESERDSLGRCTTCHRVDCKCQDAGWLKVRLKQIIDHWKNEKASLVDYSNPDICAHCGGVIRKGHTEWFHFDGYHRDSRFCNGGGGKMATPCEAMQSKYAEMMKRMAVTLVWYETYAIGCRKLGSVGDPFRQGLDSDGGQKAHKVLAAYREMGLEK